MLETVVTEIITRFFGDLIRDFHKEDLHIGVSSMEAEVKNLVFFFSLQYKIGIKRRSIERV